MNRMKSKTRIPAAECDTNEYVYRIKNTGESSAKFGPCEICGKHVSEVFFQTEGRIYKQATMTYHKCNNYFRHKQCLESVRK